MTKSIKDVAAQIKVAEEEREAAIRMGLYESIKVNDLIINKYRDEYEESESLYLVTDKQKYGLKVINLITGKQQTIFYRNIGGYEVAGQLSDRITIGQKLF